MQIDRKWLLLVHLVWKAICEAWTRQDDVFVLFVYTHIMYTHAQGNFNYTIGLVRKQILTMLTMYGFIIAKQDDLATDRWSFYIKMFFFFWSWWQLMNVLLLFFFKVVFLPLFVLMVGFLCFIIIRSGFSWF